MINKSRPPTACNLDLQIECLGCLPYLSRLVLSLLIVRVNENADNAGTRRQFVEYTEPLCLRRGSQQADAVALPPPVGKARTNPILTGSPPVVNTIFGHPSPNRL